MPRRRSISEDIRRERFLNGYRRSVSKGTDYSIEHMMDIIRDTQSRHHPAAMWYWIGRVCGSLRLASIDDFERLMDDAVVPDCDEPISDG